MSFWMDWTEDVAAHSYALLLLHDKNYAKDSKANNFAKALKLMQHF